MSPLSADNSSQCSVLGPVLLQPRDTAHGECVSMIGQDFACHSLSTSDGRVKLSEHTCHAKGRLAKEACRKEPRCVGVVMSGDGKIATLKAEHIFFPDLLSPAKMAECQELSRTLRCRMHLGRGKCDLALVSRWAALGCPRGSTDEVMVEHRRAITEQCAKIMSGVSALASSHGTQQRARLAPTRQGAMRHSPILVTVAVGGEPLVRSSKALAPHWVRGVHGINSSKSGIFTRRLLPSGDRSPTNFRGLTKPKVG